MISSLQNPLVKHLVKLQKSSYRKESQSTLVEGRKIIEELRKIYTPVVVVATEGKALSGDTIVSDSVMKKIATAETPDGVAAEFPLPKEGLPLEIDRLLVLDAVSDPGNMGALFRSAYAFGFQGAFLLSGSCDPFNEKALRAARGATFYLPFKRGSISELKEFSCYAADLSGQPLEETVFKTPLALIMGNEATGLSKECHRIAHSITICMSNPMESLNVAVAGAICMHHIARSL